MCLCDVCVCACALYKRACMSGRVCTCGVCTRASVCVCEQARVYARLCERKRMCAFARMYVLSWGRASEWAGGHADGRARTHGKSDRRTVGWASGRTGSYWVRLSVSV